MSRIVDLLTPLLIRMGIHNKPIYDQKLLGDGHAQQQVEASRSRTEDLANFYAMSIQRRTNRPAIFRTRANGPSGNTVAMHLNKTWLQPYTTEIGGLPTEVPALYRMFEISKRPTINYHGPYNLYLRGVMPKYVIEEHVATLKKSVSPAYGEVLEWILSDLMPTTQDGLNPTHQLFMWGPLNLLWSVNPNDLTLALNGELVSDLNAGTVLLSCLTGAPTSTKSVPTDLLTGIRNHLLKLDPGSIAYPEPGDSIILRGMKIAHAYWEGNLMEMDQWESLMALGVNLRLTWYGLSDHKLADQEWLYQRAVVQCIATQEEATTRFDVVHRALNSQGHHWIRKTDTDMTDWLLRCLPGFDAPPMIDSNAHSVEEPFELMQAIAEAVAPASDPNGLLILGKDNGMPLALNHIEFGQIAAFGGSKRGGKTTTLLEALVLLNPNLLMIQLAKAPGDSLPHLAKELGDTILKPDDHVLSLSYLDAHIILKRNGVDITRIDKKVKMKYQEILNLHASQAGADYSLRYFTRWIRYGKPVGVPFCLQLLTDSCANWSFILGFMEQTMETLGTWYSLSGGVQTMIFFDNISKLLTATGHNRHLGDIPYTVATNLGASIEDIASNGMNNGTGVALTSQAIEDIEKVLGRGTAAKFLLLDLTNPRGHQFGRLLQIPPDPSEQYHVIHPELMVRITHPRLLQQIGRRPLTDEEIYWDNEIKNLGIGQFWDDPNPQVLGSIDIPPQPAFEEV